MRAVAKQTGATRCAVTTSFTLSFYLMCLYTVHICCVFHFDKTNFLFSELLLCCPVLFTCTVLNLCFIFQTHCTSTSHLAFHVTSHSFMIRTVLILKRVVSVLAPQNDINMFSGPAAVSGPPFYLFSNYEN